MELKTAIEKFLLSYEGVCSPATIRWYRQYLKPLDVLSEKPITEITVDDLRACYVSLVHHRQHPPGNNGHKSAEQDGYPPHTLHCFVRSWRRLFNWCVEEGHLQVSPARRLRLPHLPDPDPKAVHCSDYLKLLAAARVSMNPRRDEALVRFLADTNARVGGVAGLKLDHLHIDRREAVVYEKGRGGNGKARQVYFTDKTKQALASWLIVRPQNGCERVFRLTESGIYQVLKHLAADADVEGPCNPHAFRHAFALGMLAKGANLGQVSQLMGHASITVTDKYYGRFADRQLRDFHERYTWVTDADELLEPAQDEPCAADQGDEDQSITYFWITVPQALEIAFELGIPTARNTVSCAANGGRIYGAVKQGRDWLLPRAEFLAWLKNRHRPKKVLA